jgi:hypothetical protein
MESNVPVGITGDYSRFPAVILRCYEVQLTFWSPLPAPFAVLIDTKDFLTSTIVTASVMLHPFLIVIRPPVARHNQNSRDLKTSSCMAFTWRITGGPPTYKGGG